MSRTTTSSPLLITTMAACLTLAAPLSALALTPAEDADLDNMLDSWELANGLNPADPNDADLDADSDGVPNKGEYHLGSDPNDALSLPTLTDNYAESFEAGTLPAGWFVPTAADAGWAPTSATANDGSLSLQSGSVTVGDSAEVTLAIYLRESSLNLSRYWNAQSGDDFRVYVDGMQVYTTTNAPRGWVAQPKLVVGDGYHEISFRHDEDTSPSRACQCTRIDALQFTLIDADDDGLPDEWELANGLNPADPADALLDPDGDTLDTLTEYNLGTDFTNADSDGDGLTDGEEVNTYGTDPLGEDSDADGMPDAYEVSNGFDPLDDADAAIDTDGDGVSNLGEFNMGTDPLDPSSVATFNDNYTESFEGGVLPPDWSVPPGSDGGFTVKNITASDGSWSLESDQIGGRERAVIQLDIAVHLSDLQFDMYLNATNGFGFGSNQEVEVYVDGVKVYAESSLPRGWTTSPVIEIEPGYHQIQFVHYEDVPAYACQCLRIDNIRFTQVDYDEDGMRDAWESWYGLDPTDPADADLDLDGDGLTNLEEYQNNTRPQRVDSDFDTVSDYDELITYGTDPNNRDTDGDLINDDYEIAGGLDPLDPGDALLDSDSDSYSNFVEYRLESDPDDAGSIPALQEMFTERFESGLPLAWYNPDGATGSWYLTSDDASEGSLSFRNQPHPAGGSTSDVKRVRFMFNVVEGTLTFDYRHQETIYEWPGTGSGHTGWFRAYLDGSTSSFVNSNNRTNEWQTVSVNLDEGVHEIEFLHSSIHPQNHVYIDNVRFVAKDADGDKLEDAWELQYGLDPTDPSDALGDLDGDGLNNLEERWTSSNPTLTDTDGDGVSDADEVRIYGTRSWDSDQDNDRMSDGYEVDNGLDPNDPSDKLLDSDNDGVQNYGEALMGTDADDPLSTPAFSDNFVESFEAGVVPPGWFTPFGSDSDWEAENITAADGSWSLKSGTVRYNGGPGRDSKVTMPIVVHESDFRFNYYWNSNGNDVLRVFIDDVQVMYITDAPRNWQTSPVFRLTEGYHEIRFEFSKINGTNRACICARIDNLTFTLRDQDLDRLPDEFEVANGLDPNDDADADLDPDGDGLTSFAEWQIGTEPDANDTDGDGVSDGDEVNTHGSDPLVADTDGDELDDGWEVANGLNPTFYGDAYEDPDSDGVFTLGEVRLGRDPFVAEALPAYNDNYTESFEGGVLPADWFTPSYADDTWSTTTATAQSGSYSLQSEQIQGGEIATVVLPITTHLSDLQLWHYWNAGEADAFRVYINGELIYDAVNPPRGWVPTPLFELPPGYNEIRIEHAEVAGAACQCTRIDSLQITRVDADGDGMRDSWELANGLDPSDAADGLLDSDGDGLNNRGEYAAGGSLTLADGDGDGVSDADEGLVHRTRADNPDTDGDFIPDGFEVSNGLNPRVDNTDIDTDGDGYLDIEEYRLGSLPNDDLSTPPFIGDFIESFESGISPTAWYQPDPDRPIEWVIDSSNSSDGSSSLGTTPRGVGAQVDETRTVEWMFNARGSTYVIDHDAIYAYGAFGSGDFFRIYLDDVLIEYRSGEVGWFDTDYPFFDFSKRLLSPGVHTMRFIYESGGSDDGSERAWIDNLRFDELGSP